MTVGHPLDLSYNWRTPMLFATVGAVVCVGALARSRVDGWVPVALIVLGLWLLFAAVAYLRTRAFLRVDGASITVRRYRGYHTIEADRLVSVREFLTPQGPCYRLSVREDDGRLSTRVAPVALLRAGHSTLLAWILARAPQAELDKASRRTVGRLQERGLL